MWEDIIKRKSEKLQIMARAAEGYGGKIFWLPEGPPVSGTSGGLDIVFFNTQDRDSWSAEFVFEVEIEFREEIADWTNRQGYWAFIKYEDKIGERDAGDAEIDLPQPGEKALWRLKLPNWQKENM